MFACRLVRYEDLRQGKGGLAGVVEAASVRSRVKVQFSAQQTADASARKAAGRMLRRVRSGKRGKLSQLRGAGSRGGSPRSAGGSSPKPPTSPAPAPVQGAASGAGAAPSISADEWSKKTPEEQAAARKAYVGDAAAVVCATASPGWFAAPDSSRTGGVTCCPSCPAAGTRTGWPSTAHRRSSEPVVVDRPLAVVGERGSWIDRVWFRTTSSCLVCFQRHIGDVLSGHLRGVRACARAVPCAALVFSSRQVARYGR